MHQKTLYHRQYIIINQEFSRAGQPFRTEGVGDQKGSEGHKNKGSTLHAMAPGHTQLLGSWHSLPEVKKIKKPLTTLLRPTPRMPPPRSILQDVVEDGYSVSLQEIHTEALTRVTNFQITYSQHFFFFSP